MYCLPNGGLIFCFKSDFWWEDLFPLEKNELKAASYYGKMHMDISQKILTKNEDYNAI